MIFRIAGILFSVLLLAGCMSAKNTTPKGVDVAFAKIKPGIGNAQVYNIVGKMPSDSEAKNRGTGVIGVLLLVPVIVWDIPQMIDNTWYVQVEYYKGQGQIIYDDDQRVRQVLYDPTEDGYK